MALATDELDASHDLGESDVANARLGTVVGGTYRLTRYIGSGGSGHVFEAEHLRLGKAFAVKLLRPEISKGTKAAHRFRHEAKVVARLQSEHIVSVIDCGEGADRAPYFVMELLTGEDLRSLLRREGQLPVRRAINIIVQACRGLDVVHAAGLVHRDVKPENLFITKRNTGQDWCKVLDFGVAKMDASLSTAQGTIVGTVRYMAPEQLANSAGVDSRTDVYAMGAILYECLAGCSMHEGETVEEVMYSVMNREPIPLRQLRPDLSAPLVEVVARCASKEASLRPDSMLALADDLLAAIAGSAVNGTDATLPEHNDGERRPPGGVAKSAPAVARWRLLLAFAGVAGFGVGALVAGSLARQPHHETTDSIKQVMPVARSTGTSRAPETEVVPSASTVRHNIPPEPSIAGSLPNRSKTGALGTTHRPQRAPFSAPPPGRFDQANPYGE